MSNRVIVAFKRNDQANPDNMNRGLKDLMPAEYYDERTHGEFVLDPESKQAKAYWHVEFEQSDLAWLKELVSVDDEDADKKKHRDRKYRLDPEEMKTVFNDLDLVSKIRSGDPLPLYNGKGKSIFRKKRASKDIDYLNVGNKFGFNKGHKKDVQAVFAGDWTIGTIGADYLTEITAAGDCGTQTALLRFFKITSILQNALANFTHNNGGFGLGLGSNTPHNGDVTAGFSTTVAHNSHGVAFNMSGGGIAEVAGYKYIRSVNGSNSNRGLIISTNPGSLCQVHDMFLDGGGLDGAALHISAKVGNPTNYNIVAYDSAYGIYSLGPNGVLNIENSNVLNCTTGVGNNYSVANYRTIFTSNNIVNWDLPVNATGNSLSATTVGGNAFGTNVHNGLTELNEIISNSKTNPEFCHLKTGGVNELGGVIPLTAVNSMNSILYAGFPVGAFMPGGGGVLSPKYFNKFLAGM